MKQTLFIFLNLAYSLFIIIRIAKWPWLVWLSWLGIIPQSKRLLVQFLVRGTCLRCWFGPWSGYTLEATNQCLSFSHWGFFPSFSLHSPLSKNKYIKSFKKRIAKFPMAMWISWSPIFAFILPKIQNYSHVPQIHEAETEKNEKDNSTIIIGNFNTHFQSYTGLDRS